MANSDIRTPARKPAAAPAQYDNCDGVDADIRSLYEAYGGGDVPDDLERLAGQLGEVLEAKAPD